MYNYILTGTHTYIHSQVFMPHGYTDDIPQGYRKSFSLMGKVKSCMLTKGLGIAFSKLNKRKGAETNYFLLYTILQLS